MEWDRSTESLAGLDQIRVSRCVVPRDPKPVAIELHNFSDASTVGYGACAYVRVVLLMVLRSAVYSRVNQG